METIELNNTNCKEYTTKELMAHCGLTDADFAEETTVEVGTKVTAKNERIVERRRNGVVTDTCLIDFEEEEYFGEKVYTVCTWYEVNEPYAYRTKEKNMEFKTVLEARKEMRNRVIAWEKRFKAL
jgi:hypothetical protein